MVASSSVRCKGKKRNEEGECVVKMEIARTILTTCVGRGKEKMEVIWDGGIFVFFFCGCEIGGQVAERLDGCQRVCGALLECSRS